MGNLTSSGLTVILLLISIMLVGTTVTSIFSEGTTEETTEEDLQQMLNEAINEISTYLQIKDQLGKYYNTEGTQKIQRIALLISPLFSQEINLSQLTIKLSNGETINILSYSGNSEKIGANTLFEHPIWNNLSGVDYSFIVINDHDNALVDYDVLDEDTDMAYIVFILPENMYLTKYDSIKITLFPSSGITRVTELEAPMPMNSVVVFE